MSTQELPEELIILGNGFDLRCGLKSSYTSFFESHIKDGVYGELKTLYNLFCETREIKLSDSENKLLKSDEYFNVSVGNPLYQKHLSYKSNYKKYNNKLSEILKEKFFDSFNFFDVYFMINAFNKIHYPNWSDIELAIQKLLTDQTIEGDCYSINLKELNNGIMSDEASKEILFIIELFKNIENPLITNGLEKRLLTDLIQFEESFKNYLTDEIYKSSYYRTSVEDLLLEMVDFYETPINILSFNYTNTLRNNIRSHKILNIENVHGTLGSKTVFGVDETAIGANSKLYMFTKTSRMMSNSSYNEKATPILHPNIKKINFYGHSLSEMDYSYFQSIFDFYNLYGSNVQLFFYYSNYNGTELEDIKSNYLQAITKMIHKYGATMNNKDHGRNLQHKLLLEKRIHIICI